MPMVRCPIGQEYQMDPRKNSRFYTVEAAVYARNLSIGVGWYRTRTLGENRPQRVGTAVQPLGLSPSYGFAATHGVIDFCCLHEGQNDMALGRHKAVVSRPGKFA